MADNGNSATFNLKVTSNGTTEKETKAAKELNAELAKAAKAQSYTPKAVVAARQGVDNSGDSGKARGITGSTGAEGRDFAKQASGLGGLVHVYATFAANLFAISAGFQALSKAADISNMVKGLDQLGAASGRSLGSLAKQLAQVTDGAVSLQDAMTATAQASSAGMTSANILRMGDVAKKASQVLGRDMGDALSRLSRGITKIEPELLDELGIMVKVDQASQNYARSIGKSASALTDFEKRQAFANEVLSQAEQKFGSIKLDANPYQKILASIQNLMQSGLELVNKVLTPVLDLLSKSPTALAVVLAGIGTMLLKQAIPAISMFRENLSKAAEQADALSAKTAERRKTLYDEKDVDKIAALGEKEIQVYNKLSKARSEYLGGKPANTKARTAIIDSGVTFESLDQSKIAAAEMRYKAISTELMKADASLTDKRKNSLTAEAAALSKIIPQSKELLDVRRQLEIEEAKSNSSDSIVRKWNAQVIAATQANAVKKRITSNAAENFAALGPIDGLKALHAEIQNARKGLDSLGKPLDEGTPKLTAMGSAALYAKGTLAGFTSVAMLATNAISTISVVIGAAVLVFELLDMAFSTSAKQSEAFNSSLSTTNEAVANVSRTMDALYKKNPGKIFNTEGIQAAANALNELSDAVIRQATDFDKLQAAMSWWDKAWDNIKGVIGKSASDKLAKSSADSVEAALKSVVDSKQLAQLQSRLSVIAGTAVTSGKDIEKFLKPLSNSDAATKASLIADAIKSTAIAVNNSSSELTKFDTILKDVTKQAQDINNSLKLSDPFSKMGVSLINLGVQFDKALEQPIDSLQTILTMLDNPQLVGIFSKNAISGISKYNTELKHLSVELDQVRKNSEEAKKAFETESAKPKKIVYDSDTNSPTYGTEQYDTTAMDTAKANMDNAAKAVLLTEQRVTQATKKAREVLGDSTLFDAGIKQIQVGLKFAFETAAVAGAQAFNGLLKSVGIDTSVEDTKLKKQEIGLRIKEIEAKDTFLRAQIENTLELRRGNLLREEELNSIKLKDNPGNSQLLEKQTTITAELRNVTKYIDLLKSGSKNMAATLNSANAKDFAQGIGIENAAALMGSQAQKAALQSQSGVLDIEKQIKLNERNFAILQEAKDVEVAKSRTQLESLNITKDIGSGQNTNLLANIASAEATKSRLAFEKQELAIYGKITDAVILLNSSKATAENKQQANRAIANEQSKLESIRSDRQLEVIKEIVSASKVQFAAAEASLQRRLDLENRIYEAGKQTRMASLDLNAQEIAFSESMGVLSEEYLAKQKRVLDIRRQELEYETQTRSLAQSHAKELRPVDNNISTLSKLAEGTGPDSQANQQLTAEKALRDGIVATQNAENEALKQVNAQKLQGIELTSKMATAQAAHNQLVSDMKNLTDSLGGAFGKLGTAVGEITTSFALFAEETKKYNAEKSKLQEVKDDPKAEASARKDAMEQISKLDDAQAIKQKNNQLAILSSTKKLFSEKTAAYKVIAAAEKAMHVAKLGMMVKEVVTELAGLATTTTATTAADGTKAVTKVPGIFAEFGAQMGPYGWAAAAAFVAAIGLGGGGSGGPPAGFTAEEQQKVQGTGQRYENGKVVNTGLGVLGDETARNESVVKGIDLIEKHSFAGLEFSNKMLEALKAIKDNTESFGKSLLNVGGIRIKADAIKGGNWLTGNTSSKIEDAGIRLSGTIEDITKGLGQLSTYTNTTESSSGLLGLFKSSDSYTTTSAIQDTKLQGEVGAIFLSVRDALVTAGDKLGVDTVAAVVNGMDVSKAFDKVSTLGLTGQEMVDAILAQVGLVMDQASLAAFPQLTKFQQIGESFTDTVIRVADDTRIVALGMASIGKSIKPLTETIAEVPQTLLDAYKTAQTNLVTAKLATEQTHTVTGTREVGGDAQYVETYTATIKGSEEAIIGLIAAEKALNDARDAITKVTGQQTTKNIEVTERLIKLAGGTDAFLSKVDFFKSNFLSEAERLAPVQKAVSAEMERLGFASITTRDQFKRLVLGIDTTTSTGQDLYTSLMNIQEGFSMVYKDIAESAKLEQELLVTLGFAYDALILQRKEELSTLSESDRIMKERIYAIQDANKTEILNQELLDATGRSTDSLLAKRKQELRGLSSTDAALKTRIWLLQDEKKLLDAKTAQEVKIYGLLGKSEEALRLTRAQELAAIDPQLAASQLYIYALEDEASLKAKLKTAYDKEASSLKDTTSRIKDFIKTLKDYRDSLVLGDNSILTPAQKYAEAKRQFLQVSAIATNIAITDAQKQAQSEAISKLPGISDTFLTASKNIYASSDAYTADFNSVLDILDKTSSALDAQQTDAQKTLAVLDKQSTIQQLIADNTESSTVLLQKLLDAMIATEAARAGASAAGSAAAGGGFTAPIGVPVNSSAFIDPTGTGWIHGANGYTGTFAEGKQFIFDSLAAIDAGTLKASDLVDAIVKQGITSTMLDTILGKKEGTSSAWAIAHGITGFASGGTPRGLSLVGEEGPEFVDFRTPARVYSNGQTNSMFGTNQELLQEFKLLREEVAQLRAEQHEQTGNLIKFNYDANTMAADRIAGAQANAANSAEWSRRNQPKIV